MKKWIFMAAVALLSAGCSVLRTASDVARRSYIGMSVAEFKKLTGGDFSIETMTAEYTVYRLDERSGSTDHRYVSGAKLFHFDTAGRLVRIDSRDFVPYVPPGRHNIEP